MVGNELRHATSFYWFNQRLQMFSYPKRLQRLSMSTAYSSLNNQARLASDPVGKGRDTRESSRISQLATGTRTETDQANLVVDSVVVKVQRAARVTLLCQEKE